MQIIEIEKLTTKFESISKDIKILENIIQYTNSDYQVLEADFEEISIKYQNSQLLNLSYREEIYNLKYSFPKRFFHPKFFYEKSRERMLDFSFLKECSPYSYKIKTNIESNEILKQDFLINRTISLLSEKNKSTEPIKYVAGIEHSPESIEQLVNLPWCGSILTPMHLPDWYKNDIPNYEKIFSSSKIKETLKCCKFILSYSETLASDISKKTSIPIFTHLHHLPNSNKKWSPEVYKETEAKKIIQIGQEMRCLHAIYMLPQSSFKKVLLSTCNQHCLNNQLLKERKNLGNEYRLPMQKTADVIFECKENIEKWYDGNIFFLHLYDTSADWYVLKCLADNVPLVINRLPSIIEYLGAEYPLYYSCYDEAIEKATNLDLILQAHEYMKNRSAEPFFTLNDFIEEFSKHLSTK